MDSKKDQLKKIIQEHCLITRETHTIIDPNGNESAWIFDIKKILLQPFPLELLVRLFWERFANVYPFQIGGQELAAVPLIGAIVLHGQRIGKPINGFIIRKSRKPTDLQKNIEGTLKKEKIILIDDIINSGSSALYQRKVIESSGNTVHGFFSVLNYRGDLTVETFRSNGIEFFSLFTLDDFGLKLQSNTSARQEKFKQIWVFRVPNPSYYHRVPKSTPCIDMEKIYFGSDHGYFYALNQQDGSIAWQFEVGYPVQGKSILSAPAIYENLVYFGSYDGNVYALDTQSGNSVWKFKEADYVGSSPAIASDLNLLFIGLEFGFIWKKGGIAALDLKTGKPVWMHRMDHYVHSSPAYCLAKKMVFIGCNNGKVYAFDAKNGKLKWEFKSAAPVKASFEYNLHHNLIFFGSFDKNLYALDMDTGKLRGKFETKEGIYATPKVAENTVYIPSTDKHLYSIDIATGSLNWRFRANGRIMSSPNVIEGHVFFGSTDGRMYEVDPLSGNLVSTFQTSERITNAIVYNPKTQRFFLLTYANELYCLQRI